MQRIIVTTILAVMLALATTVWAVTNRTVPTEAPKVQTVEQEQEPKKTPKVKTETELKQELIADNPHDCDTTKEWIVWPDGHCSAKAQAQAVKAPSYGGSHRDWLKAAGIAESDWWAAEYIINHENDLWCATRWNGQSGCPKEATTYNPVGGSAAYGICQALPGDKMATAGADWRTNPITQLKWCNSYAVGRYGSWPAAYNFWLQNSWW